MVALVLVFRGRGLSGRLILAACVVYFSAIDASRHKKGLVVSPADGRVVAVADVVPIMIWAWFRTAQTHHIFLNVFDVHVNRSPVDGEVAHVHYRPGKFLNASLDKASVDNERNALALTMSGEHAYAGQRIGVVQIAGLIARRILCTAKPGDKLLAGQRFGLIRFGSRTDVYLPQGMTPLVCVGQAHDRRRDGSGRCSSQEKARNRGGALMRTNPAPDGGHRVMRELPLTRLLPNMLTMMSFFCGLTAVRLAMLDRFETCRAGHRDCQRFRHSGWSRRAVAGHDKQVRRGAGFPCRSDKLWASRLRLCFIFGR